MINPGVDLATAYLFEMTITDDCVTYNNPPCTPVDVDLPTLNVHLNKKNYYPVVTFDKDFTFSCSDASCPNIPITISDPNSSDLVSFSKTEIDVSGSIGCLNEGGGMNPYFTISAACLNSDTPR